MGRVSTHVKELTSCGWLCCKRVGCTGVPHLLLFGTRGGYIDIIGLSSLSRGFRKSSMQQFVMVDYRIGSGTLTCVLDFLLVLVEFIPPFFSSHVLGSAFNYPQVAFSTPNQSYQ